MFAPRCEYATDACRGEEIAQVDCGENHRAACCHIEDIEGAAGIEPGVNES
jgi:ABC-type dipeptide/oligopeptide/nickel transport system ATPase component